MEFTYEARVLYVCLVSCIALGAVTLALRFIAVWVGGRRLRWDDLFVFVSYVFLVAYSMLYIVSIYDGLGRNLNQVDPRSLTLVLKRFYATCFIYAVAVVCVRLAILYIYLIFFPQKRIMYLVYAIGALVILIAFSMSLSLFGACIPLSKFWYPMKPGHCINMLAIEIVSAVSSTVFDIGVVLLPLPVIWNLQMPAKKKLVVSTIFGLGFINIGVNIGRIVQPLVTDFRNFTRSTPIEAALSAIEIFTGILAACIPTYGPIFNYRKIRSGSRMTGSSEHRDPNFPNTRAHHPLSLGSSLLGTDIDEEGSDAINTAPGVEAQTYVATVTGAKSQTIHEECGLSDSETNGNPSRTTQRLSEDEATTANDQTKITKSTGWSVKRVSADPL